MSDEEWGPWVDHDGKGCPVQAGTYLQMEVNIAPTHVTGAWVQLAPKLFEGRVITTTSRNWTWTKGFANIVRYRVRKPKGLTMLEELIQNLPAPTKERERT
jgi:hypothetical protein